MSCLSCNGTGRGVFGGPCQSCQGQGNASNVVFVIQFVVAIALILGIVIAVWH